MKFKDLIKGLTNELNLTYPKLATMVGMKVGTFHSKLSRDQLSDHELKTIEIELRSIYGDNYVDNFCVLKESNLKLTSGGLHRLKEVTKFDLVGISRRLGWSDKYMSMSIYNKSPEVKKCSLKSLYELLEKEIPGIELPCAESIDFT